MTQSCDLGQFRTDLTLELILVSEKARLLYDFQVSFTRDIIKSPKIILKKDHVRAAYLLNSHILDREEGLYRFSKKYV